jgi:hypothetical protein
MSIEKQIAETKARLSETELASLELLAARALKDKSFAKKLVLDPGTTLEKQGLTLAKLEGAVIKSVIVTGETESGSDILICVYNYVGTNDGCWLFYWGEEL